MTKLAMYPSKFGIINTTTTNQWTTTTSTSTDNFIAWSFFVIINTNTRTSIRTATITISRSTIINTRIGTNTSRSTIIITTIINTTKTSTTRKKNTSAVISILCNPVSLQPPGQSPSHSLPPSIPSTIPVSGNHKFRKRNVIIGVASAVVGGFMICIIVYCFRYRSLTGLFKFCLTTKSKLDIEAFLKIHVVSLQRYKFSEVKKMTNSFKVKLGQGGFGAVYQGKLHTGCPVAVKLLNASKGNGEDFINEVSSISKTSHINIVTLLGFCLKGRKKALIYEFMANGSLDKFIYNRGPETIASLRWQNLYQISIGIARGLEYLHRGCNTRILHFDIKPHNILLDENFCPKISDFGLAKLCPRKDSIISMSDTRGTLGYVAPEMCNRHFGGVSHKSDVYSYGMLLLEMVGGRKNINAEASHTSEIYFPHLVYGRLELDNDVRPDELMTAEENEIAKRMTIVGLWCIQTFPNDRPTMSRVVDMLEGNMDSLEMPPKPLLSSPTRSETESSS
ncbi:LEAF RUST 10 DISEASE-RESISTANCEUS RECEPTOR-LIKE PROTEIN KINASE-like 2.5 [Glycine max]|uniref:LEAF RUST 10 DISEASE-RESISTANCEUS RECEPTOR-LIKE PROTEIN KINASE-like 2.5 n=1 Tax=Glycine max TaxID=3847 RepID=UPI001B354B47|nr:LEAF RUST 10 DISEASE-RESISTANCE LOCUS RECEPTOR-LIKE PROTEIN KINASE-like 2.5 [Glycine max]